jgi:hypothetical protein
MTQATDSFLPNRVDTVAGNSQPEVEKEAR